MRTQPRVPVGRVPRARFVLAVFAVLSLVAGCGRGSRQSQFAGNGPDRLLAPASSRLADPAFDAYVQPFYPLAIGNLWDYRQTTRMTTVFPDGSQRRSEDVLLFRNQVTRTQQAGTHEYFVVTTGPPGNGVLPANQTLVRQDPAGLYELDLITVRPQAVELLPGAASLLASATPAERPSLAAALAQVSRQVEIARQAALFGWGSGGPEGNETSMLRYPLRIGSSWAVRESPRFSRTVTGLERISTPAGPFVAWRVRLDSEFFSSGPFPSRRNTWAVAWYAHSGLVRLVIHSESAGADTEGNLTRSIVDTEQLLEHVELPAPNLPR